MKWTVYIIQTTSGTLYTGITTDLARRFEEHLKNKKGARFFNLCDPEKVLFCEEHLDRSSASKREYAIKKMSRTQKLRLISYFNSS